MDNKIPIWHADDSDSGSPRRCPICDSVGTSWNMLDHIATEHPITVYEALLLLFSDRTN